MIAKSFRGYMPAFHREAFPARSDAAPDKTMHCEAEALSQTDSDVARMCQRRSGSASGCCSGDYKLPLNQRL